MSTVVLSGTGTGAGTAAGAGSGTSRRAKQRRRRRTLSIVLPLVFFGFIVGAWQITSHFVNPLLVSSPTEVLSNIGWLFNHQVIYNALSASLQEMAIGAGIGISSGIVLGIAMSHLRPVRAVLSPFVNFFNATPLVVILPLLVIWVGITMKARVIFVVLITVWPMLLNTLAGLRNVPKGYVEVGRAFGLSERQLLFKVRIPAATPYILAGARIAGGLAIIGMIVSEMEVSFTGLGWLLMTYGQNFETGKLLAVVVIASTFGILNVGLVKLVQRLFFPWIAGISGASR